jgi:hypothetical protein
MWMDSEEEKAHFKRQHLDEIKGKKLQASKLLASNAEEKDQLSTTDTQTPLDTEIA